MKKININLLKQMINEGYVTYQKHPSLDIYVYNYTRKCMFDKVWNEVTLICRGLILDENYNLVSLPISKFFNLEELDTNTIKEKIEGKRFKVYNKLDGSCGIAYNYDIEFGISTRGSFTSDQAIWATKLLNSKYKETLEYLNFDRYSFIFEIIYKENRIVCNYGDFEDIVLIAIIDKNTGEDLWLSEQEINMYNSIGFYFTEYYPEYSNFSLEELKKFNIENKEGFVIHFENGFRIKLKFEDYIRLHSIITNITARDIWKTLKEGKNISEIIDNVPDEFDKWVREKINFFNNEYSKILNEAKTRHKNIINSLSENYTKKEFALKNIELNNNKYKGLVFSLEKGQDISEQIWKLLYPEHERAFFNQNEEN